MPPFTIKVRQPGSDAWVPFVVGGPVPQTIQVRQPPRYEWQTFTITPNVSQGAIVVPWTGNIVTDTAALTAAFIQNTARGGGLITLEPGVYVFSHGFDIPPNTTLQGSTMASTEVVLDPTVPAESIFRTIGLLNGSFACNVTLADMTVRMPHLRTGTGQRWTASSGAFAHAVGDIICPALAAPIALRCVARDGVNGTGAFTPHGMLKAIDVTQLDVRLLGTALANDRIWVRIITPGRLGTMVYETSRDGGANWVGPHATTAGVENRHAIAGTNYTLVLPDLPARYLPAAVFHPSPPVVVSGTPAADYVLSVYFSVGGPLGAAVFFVSVTPAARSLWGQEVWTYGPFATVAGTSSAHVIGVTGLTVTCHAGDFTMSPGGANYLGPSFGWSLEDGSEIVDGGFTWEVLGPKRVACISDIGGTTITYRNLRTIGGAVGLANCQSEVITSENCQFQNATGAQRWIDNVADFQGGAEGGFSNAIEDQRLWVSAGDNAAGWGLVHDGGFEYAATGRANFTGNGSGWVRLAGCNGVVLLAPYVEDVDGYTSNCSWAGRRSVADTRGVLFAGGYYACGTVIIDGHNVDGLAIYGTLYLANECFWRTNNTTTNYDGAGNQPNSNNAPDFDRPWVPIRIPDSTGHQAIVNWTRETVLFILEDGNTGGGTSNRTAEVNLATYAAGLLGADAATVRVEWTIDTNEVIPGPGTQYAHSYRDTQIFSWGGTADPKLTKRATIAVQLETLSVGAEGITAMSSDIVVGVGNERKIKVDFTVWEPGTWPLGFIQYLVSCRAKIDIFRRGHP